jgi:hypothetical protein
MNSLYSSVRILFVAGAAALLVACGGGGGGDPVDGAGNPPTTPPTTPPATPPTTPPTTPPPAAQLTLALTSTSVSVEAPVSARSASQNVTFQLLNMGPDDLVYLGGSYSTSGIQSASLSASGTTGQLTINFRSPYETPPGTYVDNVVVRACRESPCVNHIAGSPKTITVTYTVVASANGPTMKLSKDAIAVQGFVLDTAMPAPQTVDLTFQDTGTPATNLYVSTTQTGSAIGSLGYSVFGSEPYAVGRVTVNLKPPANVGAGNHVDTITVRACLDVACINELRGSPATITVQYTVSDSVGGSSGFSVRQVPAEGNDIVWDPMRQVFYVSVPATAAADANTIGVLDPVSDTFTAHAPVGANPGAMEITPDGQFLYVALRGTGAIQRLSLPSLAVDLTIPLGTQPDGKTLYSRDMHVQPGAPHTIAVVRSLQPVASSYEYDMAMFDDDVMRPVTVRTALPPRMRMFQWESPTRIFAADSSNLFHVAADGTGLQIVDNRQTVAAFDYRLLLINGQLITEHGQVMDPLTFAQVGAFAVGSSFNVAATADTASGKAFFAISGGLKTFDLATFQPIASIPLADGSVLQGSTRLIRWGNDGLALMNYFRGAPRILLITGPLVK